MRARPKVMDGERSITVRVPISIRRRGGRKLIFAPDGTPHTGSVIHRRIDNAMVKAIARAFRWREMLESGECGTIREIAQCEKINESYIGRIMRLTLLAPDIIEAVLNGRCESKMTLPVLLRPLPVLWRAQQAAIGAKMVCD